MTDHDPEPPAVTAATKEAEDTIRRVATLLQLAGWDAIVISISRKVEIAPGEFMAPGATVTVIAPDCDPVVPILASVMRRQADAIEASAPGQEMPTGYIHDRSDHASGFQEWPK